MRISSSIPIHVARAYGVTPTRQAALPAKTNAIEPVRQNDGVQTHQPGENIRQLLAGNVSGPVDFASASTPTSPAGPYQLYTRAADKIEAAVAVRIGRAIDVKG